MGLQHTVEITKADEPIALRLLSALVLGWDAIPAEIQFRLLRDAALMRSGFPNTTVLPARIMAFVDLHKETPSVANGTADLGASVPLQRLSAAG
jgi:hypothetical protein